MAASSTFDPSTFSLSNPELIRDPYLAYAFMRRHDPIHHSSMYGGSWVVFRYQDVADLLCDPRLTNNRATLPLKALPPQQQREFADIVPVLENWVAFYDGRPHAIRRQHMDRICDLYSRDVFVPLIRNAIDTLLACWEGRQDLIRDFARPLPALVIAELLGAPAADHRQLAQWSDDTAYLFGASVLSTDDLRRGQQSIRAFADYLRDRTDEAVRTGTPTMITRLAGERTNGFTFGLEAACAQAMLLMFAGLEPLRYLIGNAVWALESHPEQRDLLTRSDRTRRQAVEELLRHGSPVQYIGRMAAEDFVYKGNEIKKGQPVLLYVGAANRDDTHFEDPETLDLTRRPNRHLSFGTGPHGCIGAALVRVQASMALHALLTRFPHLRVCADVPPTHNSALGFHGFTSLTVDTRP
ncbi:cytochrome P450 [Kitasatospora sp. NPDC094028]